MIRNRGQYAIFITLLTMLVVLTVSSVLILKFESRSPDANITTGGDALWYAIVTITTVGYGDTYPVTTLGRKVAVVVMFAGVGIIGALASILASILVPSPKTDGADPILTAWRRSPWVCERSSRRCARCSRMTEARNPAALGDRHWRVTGAA